MYLAARACHEPTGWWLAWIIASITVVVLSVAAAIIWRSAGT
jgi:hypothetical protein